MKMTFALAKREFLAFFLSPLALAFLSLFLFGTLVNFFNIEYFFSKGLANVRPLFSNMPFFMIFLVAALTMKLWSEEQKQGTLEILMTLPLGNTQLILGKFIAGWAFIAVALIFTMGLPITVGAYGPLDWGPVWGGYFAAFMMGGAYLAIGLCVSSLTENQVMSLLVTSGIGLVFYVLGFPGVSEVISGWIASICAVVVDLQEGFEHRIEDVVLAFGTGSRFRSIEKGLLDSRDIFWYVSIAVFFLFLNSYFLNRKRQLMSGSNLKRNSMLMVILVGLNLICANVMTASSPLFRVDLTEGKMFSLTQSTVEQIEELDEVINVDLIFSDDMPDYLRPLVPQIKDMVSEYEFQSQGKLKMNVLKDPNKNKDLKDRLMIHYNIRPMPMTVDTSTKKGVINTFFHINLRYGNHNHVLDMRTLVEQVPDKHAESGVRCSLHNFEYEVSRGISNLFDSFQSFESVFKRMESPLVMRVYYPFTVLQNAEGAEPFKRYLNALNQTASMITDLTNKDKKAFDFAQVNIETLREPPEIFKRISVPFSQERPIVVTMEYGERATIIDVDLKDNERRIRQQILIKAQGMLPGFTRTVGLWVPGPKTQNEAIRQQSFMRFKRLQGFLGTFVRVQRINFKKTKNKIPSNIDMLLILGVENASFEERYALDQFVMSGKPVIYAAGYSKLVDFTKRDPAEKNFRYFEMTHSKDLGSLMKNYGVVVDEYLAQDRRSMEFLNYRKGTFDRIKNRSMLDVRHPELSQRHDTTKNLRGGLLMAWCAPLIFDDTDSGIEVLATTTKDSWRLSLDNIRNDFTSSPFVGEQPLAITITGERKSYFHPDNSKALSKELYTQDLERLRELSQQGFAPKTENARIAVMGSHDFISDMGTQFISSGAWRDLNTHVGFKLFPEYRSKLHSNLIFMGNLVDWGLKEDKFQELLGRESQSRLLEPMTEDDIRSFQFLNYAIVFGVLVLVLMSFAMLRRLKKPVIAVKAVGESVA